jgi:carbon storage regulator
MLVLSRRENEQIVIGDRITLTVVMIQGGKVRLGIEAPQNVSIRRPQESATRPNRPEKEDAAES